MTEKQLKDTMNGLLIELHNPAISSRADAEKQIIAKAVQLGMTYQEEKIKEGINIVFNEINKK